MTNRQTALAAIGCVGLIIAALYVGLDPSSLFGLAAITSFSTWRNRKARERDTAFWSVVWRLRQATSADRTRMLAELEPAELRKRAEAILAQDGSNLAQGDVEQFPFPGGLRRFTARVYWCLWGLSLLLLATSALLPGPLWLRCFPLLLAGCTAYGAWLAVQRQRSYDSLIEVTPFRVSELFPDGEVRTVLFSRYLELHHEPRLGRLRLIDNPNASGIIVDFRRMGFARLVELLMRYGEFLPVSSDSLPANER